MTQEINPKLVHLELGDYLELLRNAVPVDGKPLTEKEVCSRISMSPQTYLKVKRAKV